MQATSRTHACPGPLFRIPRRQRVWETTRQLQISIPSRNPERKPWSAPPTTPIELTSPIHSEVRIEGGLPYWEFVRVMLNELLVGALRAQDPGNQWVLSRRSRPTRSVLVLLRHAPRGEETAV